MSKPQSKINVPDLAVYEQNKSPQHSYDQDLQLFVYVTLVKSEVMGETEARMCVTPENMSLWTKAFTHFSIDPVENYEVLEKLGDRYMSAQFMRYIMNKYPTMANEEALAVLERIYMAKPMQADFSRQLRFPTFTRIDTGVAKMVTESVAEDVYESFFGALVTVGDNTFSPGVGGEFGYRFMEFQFRSIDFGDNVAKYEFETILKEMYDQMGFKLTKPVTTDTTVRYVIGPNMISFLQTKGVKGRLEFPEIRVADAEKEGLGAKRFAGMKAIEFLKSHGVTPETTLMISKKRSLEAIGNPDRLALMNEKLIALGRGTSPRWEFISRNVGTEKMTLVVALLDGKKTIVGRGISMSGPNSIKAAVENFISTN